MNEALVQPASPQADDEGVLGLPTLTTGPARVWGFDPAGGAASRRRHPIRMLRLIAASYLFDTLLLAFFGAAGTVSPLLPLAYGGAGFAICGVFFVLVRSGLSARTRDPNLTTVQLSVATALQLVCIAVAPELAFFFLNVLFIVFAFGALRLTVRQSLLASAIVSAATALVLSGRWDRIGIPNTTPYEVVLVWISYASTLARTMYVGLYGAALRAKLHTRNLDLAASSAEVERLASYDDLTGVLNRRMIWNALEAHLRRPGHVEGTLCVALVDIDRFKSINDQFGHAVGDAVLRELAAVVDANLRSGDLLARHGGEEFLILLATTPAEEAEAVLLRVRTAIEHHDWAGIQPGVAVTISGGIAASRPGEAPDQLVQRADTALYEAKRRGRNRLLLAA